MSKLTPDGRQRLVQDAIKKSKFRPQEPGEVENLMQRFQQLRDSVYMLSKPVYDIEAQKGAVDKVKISQFVSKLYLDTLCQFSKDELLYVLTAICTKGTMADHVTLEDV